MSTPDELLDQLRADPKNADLRERTARACEGEGRGKEAAQVLSTLTNLTAHGPGPLPCLCKRCLAPGTLEHTEQGEHFRRDFVVAEGRVLYFWVPAVLDAQRRRVERSVTTTLRSKLRKKKRRR